MNDGTIRREGNTNADGVGSGPAPEGDDGHVTFDVEVPDPEGQVIGLVKRGGM